jgi:murein DD-endopeptidase MepM/ murein hydrolase activator NlpD
VILFSFFAKLRAVEIGVAVLTVLGANPAFANSSADITAPLRAAQTSASPSTSSTQEQFRQLFASWQNLENSHSSLVAMRAPTKPDAAPSVPGGANFAQSSFGGAISSISIPSRVPVEGAHLTSGFGMREHPISGGRRPHEGVDLAVAVGTPIHATADGVIGRADWFGGYGLYVSIEHNGNVETRYGHMSRLNVAAGQEVHKGDIIGFVGTTGHSTGPHVHYEVRVNGEPVDPVPYMPASDVP